MNPPARPTRLLIVCGTLLILGSLALSGYSVALAAEEVRYQRNPTWYKTGEARVVDESLAGRMMTMTLLPWVTTFGGFALIGIGIGLNASTPLPVKGLKRDELD